MKEAQVFPDWADVVEYKTSGPNHSKLVETATYKSVIVGMEKDQVIPPHAAQTATYHFLQGSGRMIVNGQELPVREGATVVVPEGVPRGVVAESRLAFLASHGAKPGGGHGRSMKMPMAVIIGMLVLMGIMAGVMFGPAILMSRMGVPGMGVSSLMYLPLAGMLLMAGTMFFLYRRMAGKRGGRPAAGTVENSPDPGALTMTYSIPDVSCGHCKKTIEDALGGTPGVIAVDVNVDSRRATVRYGEGVTPSDIEAKLTEIGYPPDR